MHNVTLLYTGTHLARAGPREVSVAAVLLLLAVAVEDAHGSMSIPPSFHHLHTCKGKQKSLQTSQSVIIVRLLPVEERTSLIGERCCERKSQLVCPPALNGIALG